MHIGITGKIGSGKTTVANIVRNAGFEVLDADAVAHELYKSNDELRTELAVHFGESVLTADGVDRKALGAIVFGNTEKLRLLESLVHPKIRQYVYGELEKNRQKIFFVEAALLPQWKDLQIRLQQIWEVTAPVTVREKRVMSRGFSAEEARMRMASQDGFDAIDHPDFIEIENYSTEAELQFKVINCLELL